MEISIFWVRAVCEMWLASYTSKHATQLLLIWHFVCTSTRNLKTTGRIWMFYCTYQKTALLSVMFIFSARARCKIRIVSYGSKHALQSLSDEPFVGPYTQNLKTSGHIWTLSISNNCYMYNVRDILYVVLELHERSDLESYNPRHILVVLWYNTVVRILQARTYIASR